eukprot:1310096-Alexandrium_andersonii.AAC.1
MALVRFVLQPRWCPPDNAVQQAHLLQVAGVAAQPPLNCAEEVLGHHLLGPIEARVAAGEVE